MKNKSAFLTDISLFACFCFLIAGGSIGKLLDGHFISLEIMTAEIIAFVLPTAFLIWAFSKSEPIELSVKIEHVRPVELLFSVSMAISFFFLSLLLSFVFVKIVGAETALVGPAMIHASNIAKHPFVYFFAVALVPGIVEEFYLRGPVQQVFSRHCSTGAMIFLSGLVFAMLHGSINNFVGPLICGMSYAWLTFTFKSIWPGVLAHTINNVLYLLFLWFTEKYSVLGIWAYIPQISLILFLFFGYWTARAAEHLLARKRIPEFEAGCRIIDSCKTFFFNPAGAAFIIVFFVKVIFDFI